MRVVMAVALPLAGLLFAVLSAAPDASAHEQPASFAHERAAQEATTARDGDGASSRSTGEPAVVAALRANGARVLALGERGGLDGHFIELADGDAYGLYVTPDGHAVAGLLYGPDGGLLTGRQIAAARDVAGGVAAELQPASLEAGGDEPYGAWSALREGLLQDDAPATARLAHAYADEGYVPDAEALFARSGSAFGFTMGRSGPPVVLFADPACRWSRSTVVRLGHEALGGRLRLRVVPVGVLGAASAREAAAIASASDPALAWFEGHAGQARAEGARRIEENNNLFDRWGARAVPLIVWRARDGRIAQRLGDVDDVEGWVEALPHE